MCVVAPDGPQDLVAEPFSLPVGAAKVLVTAASAGNKAGVLACSFRFRLQRFAGELPDLEDRFLNRRINNKDNRPFL